MLGNGAKKLAAATAMLAACTMILAACGEAKKPPPKPIRAIKAMTIKGIKPGSERQISGTVESVNRSSLGFEVSGSVRSVRAKVGDRVKKDDVLAIIDQRQYQLNLSSQQAALRKAESDLREKTILYQAQLDLFRKQVASKIAKDRAEADFNAAKSAVDQAKAAVGNAKRDLANTVLRAPFDGVISARDIEPAVVISAGQRAFEIQGDGDLEVALSLPESIVRLVKQGDQTTVTFPTLANRQFKGTVREISARGGEANTYPVTVLITEPDASVRPGMSAEVTFLIQIANAEIVYPIPVSAVAPGATKREGNVFVFDPKSSTVRKTKVKIAEIRGNDLHVAQGLKNGDVIAVAGVSFLHDGMKVKLPDDG